MKKLFLAGLFIFSSSLMASETQYSSLEYILKNLNQLQVAPVCSDIIAAELELTDCDQRSSDLIANSFVKIDGKIDKLKDSILKTKNSKLSKSEAKFVNEAEKTVRCIEKRLSKKVKFECTDSYLCRDPYNYVMYVEEIPDQLFQENIIRSCSGIFSYTADQLAGIIFHEASHLCGTTDLEYIKEEDARPKLEYEKVSGSKNADSYRYWLEKGFSLPQ